MFQVPAKCENEPGLLLLDAKRLTWRRRTNPTPVISKKLTVLRSVSGSKPNRPRGPCLYVYFAKGSKWTFALSTQLEVDSCVMQIRQAAKARRQVKAEPAQPVKSVNARDPTLGLPTVTPLGWSYAWETNVRTMHVTPESKVWALTVYPILAEARDSLVPRHLVDTAFWEAVMRSPPLRMTGSIQAAPAVLQPYLHRIMIRSSVGIDDRLRPEGWSVDGFGLGCRDSWGKSPMLRQAALGSVVHAKAFVSSTSSAKATPSSATDSFDPEVAAALRVKHWLPAS